MERTRLRLMLDYPFFGSLALSLGMEENVNIPTIRTDGKNIQYNPEFICQLTPSQKIFVYLHEICHIILGHHVRRLNRDPQLWNIAGDYAVNLLLTESTNVTAPSSCLIDTKYIGWSTEKIYESLADEFINEMHQPKSDSKETTETSDSEENSQTQDSEENSQTQNDQTQDSSQTSITEQQATKETTETSDSEENSQTQNDQTQDSSQTSITEQQAKYNKMVEASEQFGTVEDGPNDDGTAEEEFKSTAVLISKMTAADGSAQSKAIRDVITTFSETKIAWPSILSRFMYESCETRYNWMRPNKRYLGPQSNVMLPTRHSNDGICLAVAIDTSGSIDRVLLNKFMSEFKALINSVEFKELTILSCDTSVENCETYLKGEEIDFKPRGGGGTRFAPVFDRIATLETMPACLIYFTDLQCYRFGPIPPYPVLWIGAYGNKLMKRYQQSVPFGEVLSMDAD